MIGLWHQILWYIDGSRANLAPSDPVFPSGLHLSMSPVYVTAVYYGLYVDPAPPAPEENGTGETSIAGAWEKVLVYVVHST